MKILIATVGWMMIWAIAADALKLTTARADDALRLLRQEPSKDARLAKPDATSIANPFFLGNALPLEGVEALVAEGLYLAGDLGPLQGAADSPYTIELEPSEDIHFQTDELRVVPTNDGHGVVIFPRSRPAAATVFQGEDEAEVFSPFLAIPGAADAGIEAVPSPQLPANEERSLLPESPEVPLRTGDDLTAAFIMQLVPVTSPVIPANQRSTVRFEGQVTDAQGNPLPRDVVVTLTAGAGEFQGADFDSDRAGFQVLARQGQFQAVLRSDLEAQQVRIRAAASGYDVQDVEPAITLAPLPEIETFTQVEFVTNLRPSLVSGVVDFRLGPGGTNLWGSFEDFLDPGDIGETDFDLGAALFATGTLGEWQFTGAVNTRRPLNETCNGNRLFRDDQLCENTYPVYGDSSQVDYLTPSTDSFYVRFQRDSDVLGGEPDYAMWGDYTTTEFARSSQEFTAINRQLHGFKGNYTFGNLQVTAMFANNLRPFQRDTLAPDGTSGFYFLSRRTILPGSEDIFIETEEINRPGTVLERRRLDRVSDYEIDYDRGTILFREPVYRTEVDPLGKTLVRRIVATYQVDEADGDGQLYAGRLQYNFVEGEPDDGGWLGATLLLEDQGDQDFDLYGFDLRLPLGETGLLEGEFARSSFDRFGESADGNAYRVEARGPLFTPTVQGLAYLRSAESGFSNTATTSFRPGQTRWGAAVSAALGDTTRINARFDQEINRGRAPEVTTDAFDLLSPGQFETLGEFVDNTLTTYQAGIWQQIGDVDLGLDWIHRDRTDRIDETTTNSNQLVPRLAIPITPTLSFRAQSELNFGSEDDPLYPDRHTLAFDWALQPGVTMRLSQQFVTGGNQPRNITSLDTLFDYALGDNTSLRSRYSLIGGYGGLIGQAALGLNHRIELAPGLRATLGVEHVISDGFEEETGAGETFEQPFAVGAGGSALALLGGTSYSVGLEYTNNPDFQASARLEHRDSSRGSNTVFTAAAAGKISPSLTALFRYQQANFANQTITGRLGNSIDLKLGMAYRNPASDQFNALLSYEYRRNPSTTPDSLLIDSGIGSRDHTFALEAIYAPNWQWEFYGKYAFRITDSDLADDFDFSNSIHLAQLRAAYRFAYRWDILGEVRYITQPEADYNEIGTSVELGYYLTPDLRLGVGYSFGAADNDGFGGGGYRSASGPYLGIQFKVNELLNDFGLQDVASPQQEESLTDPATTPPVEDPLDIRESSPDTSETEGTREAEEAGGGEDTVSSAEPEAIHRGSDLEWPLSTSSTESGSIL
ncbi:MAG: TonB-dependent receptor [Cyanobacteria bacterium J06626_18]